MPTTASCVGPRLATRRVRSHNPALRTEHLDVETYPCATLSGEAPPKQQGAAQIPRVLRKYSSRLSMATSSGYAPSLLDTCHPLSKNIRPLDVPSCQSRAVVPALRKRFCLNAYKAPRRQHDQGHGGGPLRLPTGRCGAVSGFARRPATSSAGAQQRGGC